MAPQNVNLNPICFGPETEIMIKINQKSKGQARIVLDNNWSLNIENDEVLICSVKCPKLEIVNSESKNSITFLQNLKNKLKWG